MEPLCAEDVSNINLLGQGTVSMALMHNFSCYIRELGRLHSIDGLLNAVLAVQNAAVSTEKPQKFLRAINFWKITAWMLN